MFKDYLYHYTNANAFKSILLSRTFWATDLNFMNDAREGRLVYEGMKRLYGDEVRKGSMNEKVNQYFDLFISARRAYHFVSFCEVGESLDLFRLYGANNGGYSIGFPRDFLNSINETRLIKCSYFDYEDHTQKIYQEFSHKVKQAAEQGEKIVTFQETTRNEFMDKISELSISLKSEEFSVEKEQRLSLSNPKGVVKETKFRVSNLGNVIIPYRELEIPNKKIDVHIVLGPNSVGNLAKAGYEQLSHTVKLNGLKWNLIYSDLLDSSYRYM